MTFKGTMKANAAALAGLLVGALSALATGAPIDPDVAQQGTKALASVIEAGIAGLAGAVSGWVLTYFSPKNAD